MPVDKKPPRRRVVQSRIEAAASAGAPSREADQAESNNVLTLPGTCFSRPLRTSLYVMSNAGLRRAPGVMTCLARLIQNRQAATGAENNNQS